MIFFVAFQVRDKSGNLKGQGSCFAEGPPVETLTDAEGLRAEVIETIIKDLGPHTVEAVAEGKETICLITIQPMSTNLCTR